MKGKEERPENGNGIGRHDLLSFVQNHLDVSVFLGVFDFLTDTIILGLCVDIYSVQRKRNTEESDVTSL